MKKIFTFLIAAVICFSCVVTAFADMDGPTFFEYEKTVTEKNGAEVFVFEWSSDFFPTSEPKKSEEKIPYGTKVTVNGVFEVDGVQYASCYIPYTDKDGRERIRSLYLKTTDLEEKLPDYEFKDMVKLAYPNKVVVINPDGIQLRSGPDNIYPFSSKIIPYGTELECTYENSTFNPAWSYTEYKGERGWFESFQFDDFFNCAEKVDENSFLDGTMTVCGSNTILYKSPDLEEAITKIPVGTELKFDMYYSVPHGFAVYVEYNGNKGWVSEIKFNGGTPEKYVNLYGLRGIGYCKTGGRCKLYSEAKNTLKYNYIDIKENTFFDYTGYIDFDEVEERKNGDDKVWSFTWIRVNIDGKTGWIYYDTKNKIKDSRFGSSVELIIINSFSFSKGEAGAKIKEKPEESSKTIGSVSENDIVYYGDSNEGWIYIFADGKSGWTGSDYNYYNSEVMSMNCYGLKAFNSNNFDYSWLKPSAAEPQKFNLTYYQKPVNKSELKNNKSVSEIRSETSNEKSESVVSETSNEKSESVVSETATDILELADTEATIQNHMTPTQIAVCCAVAAVVLAATAAVIIKLINKKKE